MSKGRMCPMMFMGRPVTPETTNCSCLEKACAWYIVETLHHPGQGGVMVSTDFSHCAIEMVGREK